MPIDHSPKSLDNRTTRSTFDCRICKAKDSRQNEIKINCCKCKRHHHLNCAGISMEFYNCYIITKKMQWLCYICESETMEGNMESINKVEELINSAHTEIQKIKQQNSTWKQELEVKINEKVRNEVKKQVNNIQPPKMNDMSRRKNLLITGVPKVENEDIQSVVKSIASIIGYNSEFWLDNCFRIAKKQGTATTTSENILIKFITEINRDQFLKSYLNFIKKKKFTPASIGLHGEHRIYINEHLSEELNKHMKEVIALKYNGKVEKVYAHSNHIMVKMKDGWMKIKDSNDLDHLKRQIK